MGGGGDQKQVFNRIRKRNLEVYPAPWDHNYCRISSKLHERGGRLAVKKLKTPIRVETRSISISENLSDQRKTRDGSFCFSTVSTTSTVRCVVFLKKRGVATKKFSRAKRQLLLL